ncbi:MAG: CHAP domain-containing protein [Clostridia bacterium]|nr:CHAP domain-containing protein [Clostridia bacterium]
MKYQQRLKDLAYLTTEPDGTYGKDTLAGIKLFQDKNGLISDGYLGPATKDLLDSSEALPNALTIGDSGDTITKVQKRLVEANCLKSSSTTGYYGSITEAAVRLFQKTNNLAVDGKVGKQTITLLMSDDFKKALNPISASDGDGSSSSGDSSSSSEDNVVAAPSKDKIADMLAIARSKLGSPYVRGAKGPNEFDCSGFVYWVLNKAGIKQSYMTSYGWRTTSKYKKITDINALKAGDIIVFHMYGLSSTSGHMGIVSSNTNMVHAISKGVIETSYKQTYWKSRFVSAYRIF